MRLTPNIGTEGRAPMSPTAGTDADRVSRD